MSAAGPSGMPSPFSLSLLVSLILHVGVLLIPQHVPPSAVPSGPLQARLTLPPAPPEVPVQPLKTDPKTATGRSVMAVDKPAKSSRPAQVAPKWTAAQKNEMNRFLEELASNTKPPPTLAERSVAMARDMARQQAQESEADRAVVERLPNSPPIDQFGLDMYMEALVKKLNRSADFVKNDPRAKGLKVAAVQVRLNPNGSLHSFKVLNAGDQIEEIGFIRKVVEQAVPFAAFPADIQRSAKTLSLIICIMPPRAGAGFGFSRNPDGRSC